MAFNKYQHGAYALGTIDVDPYHLNIFQEGVYALGDNGPVVLTYTSSGGFILGGNSTYNLVTINTLNINYVSSGGFILGGDSVETSNGTYDITINYLITGPTARDIANTNKYFKLEITNDVSFDNLSILLISSDNNATFSTIIPINDEDRYIEFFYFPSKVGVHYIEVICNDNGINFVGNKFKFLSTSSDSEEGLHPQIKFEVDFRLENINLDINAINAKSVNIPDVGRNLKQGDRFTLNGQSALYIKNNYLDGVLRCLKIIN